MEASPENKNQTQDAVKSKSNGSGQTLIHLEGVTKVFFTDEVETHALSGIYLEIKRGEYLSISGPSGCGKSTLLSILGLLDSPTDGKYVLNSAAVEDLSISDRTRIRNREIGFIFQAFNLIGDLTVYENVELPLTYRGMAGAERRQRVQEALERVGQRSGLPRRPAWLPAPSITDQIYTAHGTLMILFAATPLLTGLGNRHRPAADRRARHGLPLPERAQPLADHGGRVALSCSRSSWVISRPPAGSA